MRSGLGRIWFCPGVQRDHSNPKTPAWSGPTLRPVASAEAQQQLSGLVQDFGPASDKNVPVLTRRARVNTTFVERGQGAVLLAWENERILPSATRARLNSNRSIPH